MGNLTFPEELMGVGGELEGKREQGRDGGTVVGM